MNTFYQVFVSVNKYNISMEIIGAGSSRTAYALEDWLCLKKATSQKGIAQTKQEVRNYGDGRWKCFAKVFSYQTDFTSLVMERLKPVNDDEFVRLVGTSQYRLRDVLKKECPAGLAWQDFVKSLHCSDAQRLAIADLFKFYELKFWREDDLLLNDLARIQNWGVDEDSVVKLLDYGISREIKQQFYS